MLAPRKQSLATQQPIHATFVCSASSLSSFNLTEENSRSSISHFSRHFPHLGRQQQRGHGGRRCSRHRRGSLLRGGRRRHRDDDSGKGVPRVIGEHRGSYSPAYHSGKRLCSSEWKFSGLTYIDKYVVNFLHLKLNKFFCARCKDRRISL
jgi:hypothetical protein